MSIFIHIINSYHTSRMQRLKPKDGSCKADIHYRTDIKSLQRKKNSTKGVVFIQITGNLKYNQFVGALGCLERSYCPDTSNLHKDRRLTTVLANHFHSSGKAKLFRSCF